MIEVYEKTRIPEDCSTCLYGRPYGCAHADRKEDWLQYRLYDRVCPSYWLDQNRFERALRP